MEDQPQSDLAFSLVYKELKLLAAAQMSHQRADHSLSTTVLVHEAYLRLRDHGEFRNRSHYFATAALAMRHILIDHACARLSRKHGGGMRRHDATNCPAKDPDERLLYLDAALTRLVAQVVLKESCLTPRAEIMTSSF
jgi:RNA polymerase sigma factor (TIGR02999 family)